MPNVVIGAMIDSHKKKEADEGGGGETWDDND